jgi:hypothetical protein
MPGLKVGARMHANRATPRFDPCGYKERIIVMFKM